MNKWSLEWLRFGLVYVDLRLDKGQMDTRIGAHEMMKVNKHNRFAVDRWDTSCTCTIAFWRGASCAQVPGGEEPDAWRLCPKTVARRPIGKSPVSRRPMDRSSCSEVLRVALGKRVKTKLPKGEYSQLQLARRMGRKG